MNMLYYMRTKPSPHSNLVLSVKNASLFLCYIYTWCSSLILLSRAPRAAARERAKYKRATCSSRSKNCIPILKRYFLLAARDAPFNSNIASGLWCMHLSRSSSSSSSTARVKFIVFAWLKYKHTHTIISNSFIFNSHKKRKCVYYVYRAPTLLLALLPLSSFIVSHPVYLLCTGNRFCYITRCGIIRAIAVGGIRYHSDGSSPRLTHTHTQARCTYIYTRRDNNWRNLLAIHLSAFFCARRTHTQPATTSAVVYNRRMPRARAGKKFSHAGNYLIKGPLRGRRCICARVLARLFLKVAHTHARTRIYKLAISVLLLRNKLFKKIHQQKLLFDRYQIYRGYYSQHTHTTSSTII